MDEQEFYDRCSYLLGVHHEFRERTHVPSMPDRQGNTRNTYKARYNGREGGNGRFPGSGVIRDFGSVINVTLTTPPLCGHFKSYEDALEAITKAMALYIEQTAEKARVATEQALKDNPVGYRIAGPEEIDLSRRQHVRGNQIAATARIMNAEERKEMERLTLEAHEKIDALLKDRKPRFANRRRCRRCDTIVNQRCDAELCGYNE